MIHQILGDVVQACGAVEVDEHGPDGKHPPRLPAAWETRRVPNASELERMAAFVPAAWRRRVAACGGVVHEHDGLAVCLTGVPVAAFNPTLIERAPVDIDAALADAEARYEGSGFSFGIDLEPSLHGSVREAAQRRGLTMIESRPGMWATIGTTTPAPPPDGVEVLRVDDAALLDAVVEVDEAAFGGEAALTRRFLPDAVLEDSAQRVYAARVDGRLVGAGESTTLDGVLGVFGIATRPEYRRRGIGTALTWFLMADRADDADLAVLDASDLGESVYRRLGFTAMSTWEVWVRAGSGD
jgi:ribosomal protein S18 acetylase RimI-like enzyme